MRSMKGAIYGYCRRQARREVYKAFDVYQRSKQVEKDKRTNYSEGDEEIGFTVIVSLFLLCVGGIIHVLIS